MAINKVLVVDDSEAELVNLKKIVASTGALVSLARSMGVCDLATPERTRFIVWSFRGCLPIQVVNL